MANKRTVAAEKINFDYDLTSVNIGAFALIKRGHEDNKVCIVVGALKSGEYLIADGKRRKLEKPKLKRVCHVQILETNESVRKLILENSLTNSKIRRILFLRRDYSAKG